MRFLSASLAAIAALTVPALAQVIVVPNGMAAAEGSTSNAFPWGRGGTGIRIQTIYDSTHFTLQGVTTPVYISRLRWRPNTSVVSAASSYATGATVKLSTCPVDQNATTTTFADNQGPDVTTTFTGPVSWPANTAVVGPCPFLIDVPFQNNFLYNPAVGDLNIETDIPIQTFTGTALQIDVHGTAPLASRAYLTTGYVNNAANAIATGRDANHGVVVEVTYAPATNVEQAFFTANVTRGASPLAVQFTDQSYTTAAGITSWAWDVDGDNIVDYTTQNPTHTYTTCGTYSVRLTVNDGVNAPSTMTRTNYIVTDIVTPSFTFTPMGGGMFQFTDTSTPTPTSWAWDFDGDNVTDSTVQNPMFTYPSTGCVARRPSLTVSRLCRGPFSIAQSIQINSPNTATNTLMAGGNGNSSTTWVGNMIDLVVNNPQGIAVCAVTVTPYLFADSFVCDVYVTPNTYVGNNTNPAVWRKVGTGTGVTNAGPFTNPVPSYVALQQPFYLPAGNYGFAVYISRTPQSAVNLAYTNGPVGPFGNADVTFVPASATAPGIASLGLFSASVTASRVWNGILHYSTTSSGGDAGYGFFAPGCAGTLGIPGNTASALPRLGQTMTATLSRLNLNAAFFIVGFSRTSSIFGPLPFSLTPFGAPGCFGRVSTDSVLLITGAGNSANYNLTVPNNPIYMGNLLYTQGLALDSVNVFGGVTTDAAGFVVGQ